MLDLLAGRRRPVAEAEGRMSQQRRRRPAAAEARRSARSKERRAEQRATHSHPLLSPDELAWVRQLQDPGPSILTSYDALPDRSAYRRDPDRQAAIEAHAARVAAWRAGR